MNKLDKHTFGSRPASILLVDKLNRLQDTKLVNYVGSRIKSTSVQLKELHTAYSNRSISPKTFGNLLQLLRREVATDAYDSDYYESTLNSLEDSTQVYTLCANVRIGLIKEMIRKAQLSSRSAWVMEYPDKRGLHFETNYYNGHLTKDYKFFDSQTKEYRIAGSVKIFEDGSKTTVATIF